MKHHKTAFPWASITPTLHAMCAHSWELFEITGGKSICVFCEQAVEAWNKYIKAFKSGIIHIRSIWWGFVVHTWNLFLELIFISANMLLSEIPIKLLQCGNLNKWVFYSFPNNISHYTFFYKQPSCLGFTRKICPKVKQLANQPLRVKLKKKNIIEKVKK